VKALALLVLVLVLAGCTTTEPVEIRNVYLYPDSAAETGEDAAEAAPGHEAAVTPEPSPEASQEADSAQESASEATTDSPYQDSAAEPTPDAAHEADAPVEAAQACTGPGLGEGCEGATPDNAPCCPGLLCSALRCVDPNSGVDGATACPCNSCGCAQEGPVTYVNGAKPLCPALWVCFGPASSMGCDWRPYFDGNQSGGYCEGKALTMIQCAPCYAWKPCN